MAVRPRTRRARDLRKNATEAERLLWRALRESFPVRVRRQHPIGRHIADFAIPAHKLVIEIDGGQHATAVESDTERTRALSAHGYRVVRFWNNDVLDNLAGVIATIAAEIDRSPHLTITLSAPRGGEGTRGELVCACVPAFPRE